MIAAVAPPACFAQPDAVPGARRPSSVGAAGGYADVLVGSALHEREVLLRQARDRWCVVTAKPGAFSVDELVRAGVPRRNARRIWMRMERFRSTRS